MRLAPGVLVSVLGVSAVLLPATASAAGLTCAAGEICLNDEGYGGTAFWTTTSYSDDTHYDNFFYGTSDRGRDDVNSVWNRKPNGVRVIDWRSGADVTYTVKGYSGEWIFLAGMDNKNNQHLPQ